MSRHLAASANADGPREELPQALQPEDSAAREAQVLRARLRRRFAFALLAAATVLGAIGLWTTRAVERSLHDLRAVTLTTLLEAQTKTLQVWIDDRTLTVRRLARDPLVRESVGALVAIATRSGTAPEQYCAAPARRPLVARASPSSRGCSRAQSSFPQPGMVHQPYRCNEPRVLTGNQRTPCKPLY